MARLEIGVDEQTLEWFAHKAQRLGQTDVDYARTLIEREARSEQTWQTLEDQNSRMRDRLKSIGQYQPGSRSRKRPQ